MKTFGAVLLGVVVLSTTLSPAFALGGCGGIAIRGADAYGAVKIKAGA
jgi:hypothetical protein